MKQVRFSNHADSQMLLRGATREEVEIAICSGTWERAKFGKFKTSYCFAFNSLSPVNQKFYKFKIVEPIFAEEAESIIIVTVKVYYANEEAKK